RPAAHHGQLLWLVWRHIAPADLLHRRPDRRASGRWLELPRLPRHSARRSVPPVVQGMGKEPHLAGGYEREDGERLNQLMALLGLHRSGHAEPAKSLRTLLPHAGNFNQYPRSALGLQALVSGMLDSTPVWVESCVARTVPIPEPARTRLGAQACELGTDTLLGSQIDERTGR